MGAQQAVLDQDVTTLVFENGVADARPVHFAYRAEDPYAITVSVRRGDTSVNFTLSRDLLNEGLAGSVGEGDVWITSDPGSVSVHAFHEGAAFELQCSRYGVETFLAHTFGAVPAGTESDHLDLDGFLQDILG